MKINFKDSKVPAVTERDLKTGFYYGKARGHGQKGVSYLLIKTSTDLWFVIDGKLAGGWLGSEPVEVVPVTIEEITLSS